MRTGTRHTEDAAGDDPLALFRDESHCPWIPSLAAFIAGPVIAEAVQESTLASLVDAVTTSSPPASLLELLQALGPYLTHEDDVKRTRAISFLSRVLTAAPGLVTTPDELHHLAEFYTSRLMDWVALRGALEGCLVLARLNVDDVEHVDEVGASDGRLRLAEKDAVAMLETIADSVYVRSLAAHDRSLVFNLVTRLSTAYGRRALDDVDLAELMVVSMDGEKDPGCLLDAFEALQAVCGVFQGLEADNIAVEMMRTAEEELFEVLACYFPVSFEPKERSKRKITREDLAVGLEGCLLAWPGFYGAVLDMVEEKMGSIVKQAKVDSMRLLAGLCSCDGGLLDGSASRRRVWGILRGEVLGVGECPFFGSEHPIVLSTLARCLAGSVENGEHVALGMEVLQDVVIGDCISCLNAGGYSGTADESAFVRQVELTRSTVLIFRACALAGGPVWQLAVNKHVEELLELFAHFIGKKHMPMMCMTLLLLCSLVADVGQLSGTSDLVLTKTTDEWGNWIRLASDMVSVYGIIGVPGWGAEVKTTDPLAWSATTDGCSFVWSTDPAAYNAALCLATLAKSIESIACFDGMWPGSDFTAFVVGCCGVMLVEHEGLAAVARCSLENICASAPGRRHDATRMALDYLLGEKLGEHPVHRSAMDEVFLFLASVCSGDPSRRPVVLQELSARLKSTEDLARGLVKLNNTFDGTAGAEEVGVLEEILSRMDSEPTTEVGTCDADANVARASFDICKRMTPEEQRRVLHGRLATLASTTNDEKDCNSALLGCVLGLYPEVAVEHGGLLCALVNTCISIEQRRHDSEMAQYAAASVANKTAATDPAGVLQAFDTLLALSPEGEQHAIEKFLNALAMQAGDVLDVALERVIATHRSDALRSLLGTGSVWGTSPDGCISVTSHATVAFLWEQKAYTKAKRCLATMATTDTTEANDRAALVHLIAGLPPALVRTDKAFVSAQLCSFLESASLDHALDDPSLERVLRVLTANGLIALPEMVERIGSILPALLNTALHAHYAGARRAALECLIQVATDIPYQAIHSHRRAIVKTVVAACDDNKRDVRAAAVSCRELFA